jgi:uncharacterized protein YjbI with pentapeptide repeats
MLSNKSYVISVLDINRKAFAITAKGLLMLRGLFGPSKQKLIDQMASGDNTLALQAVKELRAKGWFRDGSLRGVHLRRANLQGAALAKADLERAVLREANLTKAYLGETNLRVADLQGAILCEANMRNVILTQANLTGADLRRAYVPDADLSQVNLSDSNLRDANLWQAKLHGANLHKADMRGALLHGTRFDTDTVLPDNTNWTADTDMNRFTNPEHAEFHSLNGASKPG